jgi:hypothetical protein
MKAFVSYAAKDRAWARELRSHLLAVGIDAWIDADEILPGDNWRKRIGNALESVDALLVLISPASVHSESLRRDLQFAMGSERFERRVISVIVEPAAEMPWILHQFPSVSGEPAQVARKVAEILQPTAPAGSLARAGSR